MILLFDIDYTLFDTEKFKKSSLTTYTLYNQTKKVLGQLSSSFTLGILSQGEADFQIKKLAETKILHFFDPKYVFIIPDKAQQLPDIMKQLQNLEAAFIEDKIRMLEKAKSLDSKLKTVWFKNGPFSEQAESNFTPDYEIAKFSELIELFL